MNPQTGGGFSVHSQWYYCGGSASIIPLDNPIWDSDRVTHSNMITVDGYAASWIGAEMYPTYYPYINP